MLQRMLRAARLDSSLYEEVEANPQYMREAFFVVLLAALAGAIGSALDYGARGVVAPILGAIVGWVIWSAITLFIGTTITKGPETRSDMGEMLRTLGYAHSPLLLSVFSFLPGVGALIQSIAQFWMLVAGVVAIRQALDFTTGRAILTVFLGWLVVIALTVLLGIVFVGLAGVGGGGG
jgi:hypothetical protein